MKKIFIFITLVNLGYAKYQQDALFAEVIRIAKNDTLSVRVEPNLKSKKITELPLYARVGVDYCVKNGRSTWCKVHAIHCNLGQYLKYNDKLPGWVNGKYLKFSSRGYVEIRGKRSCNYAISCGGGKCNIVTDTTIKNGEVTSIKIKSYPRSILRGIGELDIPNDGECYSCNRISFKINDFLSK